MEIREFLGMKIQNLKQKIYKILRWSQKYTETDMVYLAKGGFWLTLGEIVSTAVSILAAIAFANLLDPGVYGNYSYILSLVGVLAIFALPAMKTAVLQAVSRGLEGSFYTGFKEKLKFGVLGSLGAIVLAAYYFFRGNYTLPIPFLIAAVFAPLMWASQIYARFLMGRKLFNFQIKYSVLNHIIAIGAMIVTLFFTNNLFLLIAVHFAFKTFLNYLFYSITKKKFKPNRKEDPKTLSYAKHMSLIGLVGVAVKELDKILLFHFLGASQLAIYSFAFLPLQPIQSAFRNLGLLSLTKLTRRNIPQIKKILPSKILMFFLATIPVIGLYILIAPYIYRLLLPRYTDSIIYSQVFVLSLFLSPKILLGQALTAHLKKKELYIRSFIYSISKAILLLIFLPLYGIWGAISALIGIELIDFLVLSILFRKI